MRIEVYLDEEKSPFQTLTPPEKFKLDTNQIEDGKHELTFRAFAEDGQESIRVIPIVVQNGPAIAIHGIDRGENLSGEIDILANAYGATFGDEFEPIRMETPAPVPTWAWVLVLSVIAWGAGYISLEVSNRINTNSGTNVTEISSGDNLAPQSSDADWVALGKQVYGNNCSSCHQATGAGLPGVFPSLKDNPAVLDKDPTDHINAILHGVANKVIDGVDYASPMPGFGSQLSDEEIAAVANHERTQWGNSANTISAEDVRNLR